MAGYLSAWPGRQVWLTASVVCCQPAASTNAEFKFQRLEAREFVIGGGGGSHPLAGLRSERFASPRFTSRTSAGRSGAWRPSGLFHGQGAWTLACPWNSPACVSAPRAARDPAGSGLRRYAQSARWAHCAGSGLAFARLVETLRHSRRRERRASTPLVPAGSRARESASLDARTGPGCARLGPTLRSHKPLRDAWAPRTPFGGAPTVRGHGCRAPSRRTLFSTCRDRNAHRFRGRNQCACPTWVGHPAERRVVEKKNELRTYSQKRYGGHNGSEVIPERTTGVSLARDRAARKSDCRIVHLAERCFDYFQVHGSLG